MDARRIRSRALEALRSRSPDAARIVVGGAGLSGVQAADELAALAREERGSASITLLEQRARVAPGFPADFGDAVARALEGDGIEIRTGATVVGADEGGVRLESGERLPSDLFVWTGGIRGPDALGGERPTVEADLRLDDRAFALGDAARVVDAAGETVPASAQAAVREARTAAENVERLVAARRDGVETFDPDLESFRFESPGWVVSIGDDAVATIGSRVLTGRPATALKASVGVGYLSGVGNLGDAVGFASREFVPDRFRRER